MLAEAAKKMEQKRLDDPSEDPRPSKDFAVSQNAASPTPRPPRPLMGGNSSLNNEILAMAAKRNARVTNQSNGTASPTETKKKHIEDVLPPQTNPLNAPTASLAEQVALLAARRHNRLNGAAEEGAAPAEMKMRPIASEPLVPPPPKPKPATTTTTITTTTNTSTAPSNNVTAPTSEPKKKAWFSKKPEEPEKIVKAKDYSTKKDVPSRPPAFQQAHLRKAQETPLSPTTTSSPPTFTKAKLKPTGIPLTTETPAVEEPEVVTEAPPTTVRRVVKAETPAPPAQKTRTVTKSDPTYEITEYKCACVIL